MGIMTRIMRVWKADLHGVMDQLEDRGLLLKQYLREMEDSLQQKTTRCEQLTEHCRQIRRDKERRVEEIDKLARDLDLAVAKSRDDIARMLIRKRRGLEAVCVHLQQQLDTLTEEQQDLERLLDRQRLQYDQLKIRADSCLRQAQARQCDEDLRGISEFRDVYADTEEEIELELIQRKEALAQGGTP